jgi:hypothetical protein
MLLRLASRLAAPLQTTCRCRLLSTAAAAPPARSPPSLLRRAAKGLGAGLAAYVGGTFVAYRKLTSNPPFSALHGSILRPLTAITETGVLGWLDEGSARSLRFWSAAFPVYLRYEFVQQRNKRNFLSDDDAMAEYEALHNKVGHRLSCQL